MGMELLTGTSSWGYVYNDLIKVLVVERFLFVHRGVLHGRFGMGALEYPLRSMILMIMNISNTSADR